MFTNEAACAMIRRRRSAISQKIDVVIRRISSGGCGFIVTIVESVDFTPEHASQNTEVRSICMCWLNEKMKIKYMQISPAHASLNW